ncbi:MAG: hypothetical protein R3E66_21070 [bacterium]
MHAPLAPMTSSEFARLANLAGLHIGEDDLVQLDRRQILRPFGEMQHYTSAHLFVLALYFDAIRVVRHPWATRAPDRKLEDVKQRGQWLDALLAAKETNTLDPLMADSCATLLMELERFLAGINPFGPLSNFFNIMHPNVFEGLRGDGRLYAELNAAAQTLADILEQPGQHAAQDEPEEDLRSTVAMDVSASIAQDVASHRVERSTVERELSAADLAEIRERDPESVTFTTPSSPTPVVRPNPVRATPVADAPADPQTQELAVEEASPDLPDTAEVAKLEPTPSPAAPPVEPPPAVATATAEAPPTPAAPAAPAANLPPAKVDEALDDFDEDEGVARPTEILPSMHRTQAPVLTEKKGFERNASHTQRTQNLMDRLAQLRNETAVTTPSDGLESQIEELNRLRESYLQAQDWVSLAKLYEDKIQLFEDPAEKQQIRIALATIYEAKLNQPRRAFESYIFAYEIAGPAGERALDGVRRTGKTEDVHNSYQAWLEDRLTLDISADERRELQGDLALLLHARGDTQRAYLMFAAFLAEDPDRHVTADSLEQLEELSAAVDEDELDAFFSDILDSGPSPRVVELVALRAGLSQISRNNALHAIPLFRKVLEAAPTNEVAFTNLSRLYEGEQNWSDLAALLRKRLTHVPAETRVKLEAALERAYENEMAADIDAVTKWQVLLESTPDDAQALSRYVFGLQAHQRHADAYAFLTRLQPQITTDAQKVRVLLSLADIATNYLHEPDEGQHHAEEALGLVGPTTDVMGALVEVHMARGDYMTAVNAVESLLAIDPSLPKEQRLEWLQVGVDAAERAHRGEERERFMTEIRQLESTHV